MTRPSSTRTCSSRSMRTDASTSASRVSTRAASMRWHPGPARPSSRSAPGPAPAPRSWRSWSGRPVGSTPSRSTPPAERAARNLPPWPQAMLEARSGAADGLPAADALYVNAGLTQPSWAWLEALRVGGRLLFPLQPEGGFGGMSPRAQAGRGWPGLARPVRLAGRLHRLPGPAGRRDRTRPRGGVRERRVRDGAVVAARQRAGRHRLVQGRGLVALHARRLTPSHRHPVEVSAKEAGRR